MTEITKQFNNKTEFQGHECNWHHILITKTRELAHYLLENNQKIDFCEPVLTLERQDSAETRDKILKMNYTKWKKQGHSKGTLHHMKQQAASNKLFKIYEKTQKILVRIQ